METRKINTGKNNSRSPKVVGVESGRPIDSESGNTRPEKTTSEQGSGTTGENYTVNDIKIISSEAGRVPSLDKPNEEKSKRGRPFGSTTTNKDKGLQSVSQKPAGKQHDRQQVEMMVKSILIIGFNITASRAGAHWALTQKEADSLAEPIAAIMERLNLTESTGKYGEYIALVVALGMIMIPKFLIHMDINKNKKAVNTHVQNIPPSTGAGTGNGSNPNAGKVTNIDRAVPRTDSVTFTDDVKGHLAAIQG